jgi:hypothetical protein
MIRRRYSKARWLALLVGLTAWAPSAQAQIVVVTAKSVTELLDDVRALAEAVVVSPEQARMVAETFDRLKAPGALKGLDRTRPLGAYADLPQQKGQAFTAVAFIPITSADDFFATLKENGFTVQENPGAEGFSHKVVLPAGNQQAFFVLTTPDHAFFSITPTGADQLRNLKPAEFLPTRSGAGDLAVNIRIDRIPGAIKDIFLTQFAANLKGQRERQPGEDENRFQGRLAGMDFLQNLLVSAIRDGRELFLDARVAPKPGQLTLELGFDALPASPSAVSLKSFGTRQGRFRSLAAGSALNLGCSLPIPGPFRELMRQLIERARKEHEAKAKDDEEKQQNEQFSKILLSILADEELDGRLIIDGPYSSKDADPTYAMLFALKIKDGRQIERTLTDIIKSHPDEKVEASLGFAKARDGTAIHRFRLLQKGDFPAQLGAPVYFAAFRDNAVYVGGGENGLSVLNKALDAADPATDKSSTPLELDVAVARLAEFESGAKRGVNQRAARAAFAGQNATRDHLKLGLRAEKEGLRLRLAVDLPVLRFFSIVGSGGEAPKQP